jgi:hypothetical protein
VIGLVLLAACGSDRTAGGGSGGSGSGGSGGSSGGGSGGSSGGGTSGSGGGDAGGGDASSAARRFRKLTLSQEFLCEGANYGDFDRDGVTDVVAGPYWYRGPDFRERTELYAPQVFDAKGYSDNFFAFVRDFSGDGWDDVLVVGFPGLGAEWFENPQAQAGPWPRHPVFSGVDTESPEFTDITGDGRPELVFASGGRLGWAEPARDPRAPWVFHPLSDAVGFAAFTHGLGVGDVNGDGKRDVLERTGYWLQPSAPGDPLWEKRMELFGNGGGQMFATDVDGDGDNDVVTTIEAHAWGLSWFEQKAGPPLVFTEHVIVPAMPATSGVIMHEPHALALHDMNGDGLEDLVTGERFWGHAPDGGSIDDPGRLYWFELRRGAQVEYVPHLVDEASGIGTQVVAGDVSADGLPDIVVSNKKGSFVFLQEIVEAP